MKKIVEYLPLLTLCLIYFGFCSLHGYYKTFGVDIYAYITASEIIMAFFPALVFLSSMISASFVQNFVTDPLFVFNPDPAESNDNPSKFKKMLITASQSIFVWGVIIFTLNFGIRWALTHWYGFETYDFQTYNAFFWMFFLLFLMWFMAHTNKRETIKENPVMVSLILVGFIGIAISQYRNLDAEKIKAGNPVHQISFMYHNKTISTGKQLLFIGQTTGHLFLYDRKNTNTLVFKSSEVDSVVIKN